MRLFMRLLILLLAMHFAFAPVVPVCAAQQGQSKVSKLLSSDLEAILSQSTVTLVEKNKQANSKVKVKLGGILINPKVVEKNGKKHLVSDCAFVAGRGAEALSEDRQGDCVELRDGKKLTGLIVSLGSKGLKFQTANGLVTIPLSNVLRTTSDKFATLTCPVPDKVNRVAFKVPVESIDLSPCALDGAALSDCLSLLAANVLSPAQPGVVPQEKRSGISATSVGRRSRYHRGKRTGRGRTKKLKKAKNDPVRKQVNDDAEPEGEDENDAPAVSEEKPETDATPAVPEGKVEFYFTADVAPEPTDDDAKNKKAEKKPDGGVKETATDRDPNPGTEITGSPKTSGQPDEPKQPMQPFVSLNFIICLTGIFEPRADEKDPKTEPEDKKSSDDEGKKEEKFKPVKTGGTVVKLPPDRDPFPSAKLPEGSYTPGIDPSPVVVDPNPLGPLDPTGVGPDSDSMSWWSPCHSLERFADPILTGEHSTNLVYVHDFFTEPIYKVDRDVVKLTPDRDPLPSAKLPEGSYTPGVDPKPVVVDPITPQPLGEFDPKLKGGITPSEIMGDRATLKPKFPGRQPKGGITPLEIMGDRAKLKPKFPGRQPKGGITPTEIMGDRLQPPKPPGTGTDENVADNAGDTAKDESAANDAKPQEDNIIAAVTPTFRPPFTTSGDDDSRALEALKTQIQGGTIRCELSGDGDTLHTDLTLTNLTRLPVDVRIPAFTFFKCQSAGIQDMLKAADPLVKLAPAESQKLKIDTFCVSTKSVKPPPPQPVSYTVDRHPRQDILVKIVKASDRLDKEGAFDTVPIAPELRSRKIAQTAIWMYLGEKSGRKTELVTVDSLVEDLTSSGSVHPRKLTGEQLARVRKFGDALFRAAETTVKEAAKTK